MPAGYPKQLTPLSDFSDLQDGSATFCASISSDVLAILTVCSYLLELSSLFQDRYVQVRSQDNKLPFSLGQVILLVSMIPTC